MFKDGKIVQVTSGMTEDHVAVELSSTGISGQFLASPAIPSGTGRDQANTVYEVCIQWDLINSIRAPLLPLLPTLTRSSGAAVLLDPGCIFGGMVGLGPNFESHL